jgi:dTDP-glucose pyrophosphorylase
MQVIIPMSGLGKRFTDAGYHEIKPLLRVNGKTFIEYVIGLFHPADHFIFICNEQQLRETGLKAELLRLVPDAVIVSIMAHKKGPVYAVEQAFLLINDEEPCIVNYCDFFMIWDYNHFLQTVSQTGCDGAIPCYTGFHPHLIPENNVYAGCEMDSSKKLLSIREKYSFEKDKFKGQHSVGTYYFKKGALLKKYTAHLIRTNRHLLGEFYCSMLYEQMLVEKKYILVYNNISHFCQWGTPEDFEDFLSWQSVFSQPVKNPQIPFNGQTILMMPMAGSGQRFAKEGYAVQKPFITVDEYPMFYRAMMDLPKASENIFISKQLPEGTPVPPDSKLIIISETTNGQAATCLLAKELINNDRALMIAPCDTGMQYDVKAFLQLCTTCDAVIFTFRKSNAVVRHPDQYGWVVVDAENNAIRVSCKKAISRNPKHDHAVVGAFWFKKGSDFVKAATAMIEQRRTIHNEYYVDECMNDCIQMGWRVRVFELDKYIGWGTPNDLKTYLYWQSFFKLVL